ncbi:MAG: hypothetical protein IPP31_15010 [Chitinophagaceae bacterium]|nr:hypothetical protein [Chitinophagaceae bacterium]
MKSIQKKLLAGLVLSVVFIYSCSKDGTPAPTDPCAGKTIAITASVTPTSGGLNNGAIVAAASGSTGFTFNIDGGAFQSSGTFNNLAPATYSIGAKDAAGCLKTQTFTVTTTPCPTITVTATTTPASTPTAPDGTLTASATGSTGFTYRINGGAYQASGNFTGLVAGNYTVTAKDLNNCTGTTIVVVGSVACPPITVTATTTPTSGPTATNGTMTANASGGATPYLFSKDGGTTFQASATFAGLAAGNYTVIAKDANNCLGTSGTITVSSTPCPTITFTTVIQGSDKCIVNTGSISVSATGSTGFMYNINGGTFQLSNVFGALAATTHNVGVRDQNGCVVTNAVAVPIAPAGPQFNNVKAILAVNCAIGGCHAGPAPQNGLDFTIDCTIVAQSARIKARAVDANPSVMPPAPNTPLSASDKQKIVDWVNGGGGHRN